MQTQTQVPGQVPRGPQRNGNAAPSGLQNSWQRWHTVQDTSLRRHVVDNIMQLLKNKKPDVTPEWQLRLPDFVKRLEEALYKNALCKEEYADLETLEQRLRSVARRMVRPQQHTQSVVSSSPLGNMIPTPGTAPYMSPQLGQPNQPNSSGQAHQQQQQGQALQHGQASSGPAGSVVPPTAQIEGPSNGVLPGGSGDPGVDAQRQHQYAKQQRWLLFMRHASKCAAPEGQCPVTPSCHLARQLWGHILTCHDRECTVSRCNASRTLLHHHQHCHERRCPVCEPVRKQVGNEKRQKLQQHFLGFLGNRRSRL